jgi:hypothetical protein
MASLAARLASVAASLTATGDKAMTTHAAALWGAAAALVGLPTAAASTGPDHLTALANKASDIIPGVIAAGPAEKATLVATALDRVREWRRLAMDRDAALRDLGWDGAENLQAWTVGYNDAIHNLKAVHDKAIADNTILRAQVDRMLAAKAQEQAAKARVDHMTTAFAGALGRLEDKPRPQPGDVVPWAEVEDGCLEERFFGAVFAGDMFAFGCGGGLRDRLGDGFGRRLGSRFGHRLFGRGFCGDRFFRCGFGFAFGRRLFLGGGFGFFRRGFFRRRFLFGFRRFGFGRLFLRFGGHTGIDQQGAASSAGG